ncbi:MAG TPA: type II toxin-antitoxin system RelE/ParE family toxin [Anaeromyxobacteraceae bacterium]|nr:type II toxin-antitoxin system RelE/ParE family toxin [Anaeromyxobacteraceae bacterium]
MKVRWTEASARRIEEIRDFVARDDPSAASRLAAELVALGESLRALPLRGRRVPELPDPALRELILRNYRLVYRVRGSAVEVLTVFEAHRLIPTEDL